jgi:hypothetical protein
LAITGEYLSVPASVGFITADIGRTTKHAQYAKEEEVYFRISTFRDFRVFRRSKIVVPLVVGSRLQKLKLRQDHG